MDPQQPGKHEDYEVRLEYLGRRTRGATLAAGGGRRWIFRRDRSRDRRAPALSAAPGETFEGHDPANPGWPPDASEELAGCSTRRWRSPGLPGWCRGEGPDGLPCPRAGLRWRSGRCMWKHLTY